MTFWSSYYVNVLQISKLCVDEFLFLTTRHVVLQESFENITFLKYNGSLNKVVVSQTISENSSYQLSEPFVGPGHVLLFVLSYPMCTRYVLLLMCNGTVLKCDTSLIL